MSNIDPDLEPQSIPGFVLWQVSKLWQRVLANAIKPYGIGSTEFVLLGNAVRLSQLGKHVTQTMLGDATKIDRMTASQTLRSLEKKGLIERFDRAVDKRTFHIVPTSAGAKLADDALGEVIRIHSIFFDPLKEKTEGFLVAMHLLIEASERIV